MRLHADFDVHGAGMKPDWDYSLSLNGRELVGITVDGVPWTPERTCTLERTYVGYPCSDWTCSACGKIHTDNDAREHCPRCGARVVRVVRGERVEEVG